MMKRLLTITLLLLGITQFSYAQESYKNIDYPKLDNMKEPNVSTFTTDNGIRFFLVEDHELPLIDTQVRIRAGGVMVPDDKTGLASLTGTVMRSGGTQSIAADSLNTLLEDKAASMETGIGFTSGYASMNVLKENFDTLLPVFVELLTNPAFPKDKIELAKKHQKSAISRRNDNIDPIGRRVFDQVIYGKNSIYARNTEYATINNINRQDLVNFHDKNFAGQNMMVGVVGDFETDAMKSKLKRAFGQIPAGQNTNLDFPKVNYGYKNTINFVDKPDVNQSLVLMGYIGGRRDNPDYPKVQVMNQVLSGGFSGRLMQQVRTHLGLAYGVGGRYGMNSFYPGQFVIQVKTKSSSTADAIDAIIKEVRKLKNNKISEDELQDAKANILNSAVFHHDSYSKILNERISNAYRGLADDAYQQYLKGVRNTSVEDVKTVAQKYLHPDSLQILVVGNKKQIGNQLQKYGDVNPIDISIPQPGGSNEQKMVKGDAKKGQQLLSQMADAVINKGPEVHSLTLSGKTTVRNRKLPVTVTINYPSNVVEEVQTGGGTMKFTLSNGKATMMAGGQNRPIPPSSALAKNLKATIDRNIVTIAKKAGDLNPQFTGAEKMDGATYNKVNVKVSGKNLTLLLSRDTNLPAAIRFKQFNPQKGQQVTILNKYSNYKSNGGVTYPHNQASFVDGKKQSSSNYDSHKVNSQK